MAEFRMPSLGADMDEGVLLEWLVQPGATVHKGDVIAIVDTSKAAVEVECFDNGVVEELLVQPGTRVPVGAVLASIATAPSGVTQPSASRQVPAAAPPPARPRAPDGQSMATSPLVRRLAAARHLDLRAVKGTGVGGRITHADVERAAAQTSTETRLRVSPLARRLARELGVDLATVAGTGRAGAIEADDVRRAAAAGSGAEPQPLPVAPPAGPASAAREERAPRTAAMRGTIATLMARSAREIPHYHLTETIDLGAALGWLREQNRRLPVPQRLVPAALMLKAAARAARAVPELNGFWVDDGFRPAGAVHLGVAISLRGGGLVAPAIHDAADLSLPELMARLKDLVIRTRAGRLRRAELADPTITVSNLGEQGVESILGIIYPPQVALVGFGRIADRPWAADGMLGVRPVVTASLAGDHRATDGATGARYLNTLAQLLHRPEEL
ncbi:MAG TPA: 2-oxo acid dehydrogenase subunit E2 [Pilimelia sp.]|nr:2-oxo acid dehydrogenase subunit E2 [Pilimelia sp.]